MKNDFDFIKEKFDNDSINIPSALDEDIIRNRLEDKEQKRLKLYQKRSFKNAVTAVACLAIAVVGIAGATPYFTQRAEIPAQHSSSAQVNGLKTFSSYEEIKSYIKDNELTVKYFYDSSYGIPKNFSKEESATDTSADIGVSSECNSASSSFGETYKQLDSVDEGDILKNDGKYIYFVSQFDYKIKIFEGTRLVNQITLDDKNEKWVKDIFIKDNLLIVNSFESRPTGRNTYKDNTVTDIYDLTDIKNPVKKNHFSQSGYYSSSRMIGDVLYIVSDYVIGGGNMIKCSDYVPVLCDGDKTTVMEAKSICCPENPSESSYLVISAVNVVTGKRADESKAILGTGDDIYCNEKNMYIAFYNDGVWKDNEYTPSNKTTIFKVALDETNISFTASCELDGYVNNQFSMDERDGYFRVAAHITDYNSGKKENVIYTFTDDLKPVGKLGGIAKGEDIKAVRFIGDMAYVITFYETDPLFVIDLSDPTAPKLKGEVKISGFSSQLIPVDDSTLLGIGCERDNENTDCLKLVLFDISNPEKPKVITSKVLADTYSNAQYNHHALVVNKEQGYYLIDFNKYDDRGHSSNGALTFTINNNELDINNKYERNASEFHCVESRATYIGDTIYVIDYEGNIAQFKY